MNEWQVDFFDDFDTFNTENWQDQMIWVNNEDHCYVPDGQYNTREVSNGTLKLRVVDLGEQQPCDNLDVKSGKKHPNTQFVAGRIISKNRKEFIKGKWSARLKVNNSGQPGMFPAWWLLGAMNNEPPIEDADETVCWPLTGSGEID
ncbi:MAG: glycoside hydrolase family 16 protein, partial [Psychroserpens sp.]|nr:glycoside hydrolase family 16 protein [Psychroserpens sp.]